MTPMGTEEISPADDSTGQFPQLDLGGDALFLDIDGTLIDIAPTPEAVVVPESLKIDLVRLRDKLSGALALLSGRTLGAIDQLFAPVKFAAAGAHGAEVRPAPDGAVKHCAQAMTAVEKAAFAEIAKVDPRIRIEDKVYTMAIHYRLAPEAEDLLIGLVNDRVGKLQENLRVLCGKAVVEVKRRGFNKGTGLRALMEHPPFAGRRPLFFGDDVTDEDALAVLPEFGGTGVSVGRLLPGATGMIERPAQLRHWLAAIAPQAPD
ncbi:MAG: trehalose-phosphatase [Alphaproteobacteria bacterium]|nr:trehalose-phosphatase [Alphaproteobacteria bacterium]MBV9064119.1 trehalose-phosphatase [Alphaproteobacteria bacterium]